MQTGWFRHCFIFVNAVMFRFYLFDVANQQQENEVGFTVSRSYAQKANFEQKCPRPMDRRSAGQTDIGLKPE